MAESQGVQFVVITGMSGAGRRTAAHTLEDLGWYLVDNLPPSMLPQLFTTAAEEGIDRVVVILDVRTRKQFEEIPRAFEELGRQNVFPQILFLEASDQIIVRRQEHVRRPHPLQGDGPLLDGIHQERAMLATLRAAADMVVDTTDLNVHELADRVANSFNPSHDDALRLTLMSFGFKRGVPLDADVVLDVRFLPNPHWVPDLRPLTGLQPAVSDYVLSWPEAAAWLDAVEALVAPMASGYLNQGKRQAIIAIGCTGGKHRSTAMTVELDRRLSAAGLDTYVLHRDLGKE